MTYDLPIVVIKQKNTTKYDTISTTLNWPIEILKHKNTMKHKTTSKNMDWPIVAMEHNKFSNINLSHETQENHEKPDYQYNFRLANRTQEYLET